MANDPYNAVELPVVREQYGFKRTVCGCAYCVAPCHHIPGSLDVSDLGRLCPDGQDIFTWAEVHLRAVVDKSYPTLVPARQANGHCHWLVDGQCAVHGSAPYSCAFFDAHQAQAEIESRSTATIRARKEDAVNHGLYHRVWLHLQSQGLIARSGDRAGLVAEVNGLRRMAERSRRRAKGG
jgi:hypothetical protein